MIMKKLKITKGKWSFSRQKGTENHCVMAQIWSDKQETYIAKIKSTEDEREANANAKLIAAAPELYNVLNEVFQLLEEKLPNWYLRSDYERIKIALENAVS